MQAYILVGAGGAIGAMGRYGLASLVGHLWRTSFPLATLLINVSGSLAMGLFVGWLARALPPAQNDIRLFIAVGILGGFTTFSAFSLDTLTLIENGQIGSAVLYAAASLIASVAGLYLGLVIMRGFGV